MDFRCPSVNMDSFTSITYLNQAVTFTFDLQNLIRSSVGASEYCLSVLLKLLKPFMIYCGNNIWPDKRDSLKMPSPTPSGDLSIKHPTIWQYSSWTLYYTFEIFPKTGHHVFASSADKTGACKTVQNQAYLLSYRIAA